MAEGKKKQKKSPWWYKLGILVFGAVFCVSAFMAGRDYLAAKKEADAFDSLSKLAAEYAEEKAPADLTESAGETTDQEKAAEWAELLKELPDTRRLRMRIPITSVGSGSRIQGSITRWWTGSLIRNITSTGSLMVPSHLAEPRFSARHPAWTRSV